MNIEPLLSKAFFVSEGGRNATLALGQALDRYRELFKTEGEAFELTAPQNIDAAWVRERLVGSLVYFCESKGTPLPKCGNVFVALWVGDKLHCIRAADIIAWAVQTLGMTVEEMDKHFGTHEVETALR